MRTQIVEVTNGPRKTGPRPIPAEIRFWKFVDKDSSPEGCWLWTGHSNNKGYGYFRIGSLSDGTRRKVLAHRWAFMDHNGSWPRGVLDHECHNNDPVCPGGNACQHTHCVNPSHLRDTTQLGNLSASRLVGRNPGQHKLSNDLEQALWLEYAANTVNGRLPYGFAKSLCEKYSVSSSTLALIVKRQRTFNSSDITA